MTARTLSTPVTVTVTVTLALVASLAAWCAPAAAQSPEVRVASKSFTESVVLGELVAVLCESTGARCPHQRGLGGTRLVWSALRAGHVDVYPEYTGTLVQEILAGQRPPPGVQVQRWLADQLRALGVGISPALGFNNTYALGMRADRAAALGIRRISDLLAHPGLRLGFSSEFISRKDGWPSLRDAYRLPQQRVTGLEHDLAYRGLAAGSLDVIDLYATDAEIRHYQLVTLQDDARHFPEYQAVLVYRLDSAARHPAVWAALARLTGAIDQGTMTALNAQAKLDRVPERAVAVEWAARQLGVKSAGPSGPGRAQRIAAHARDHLQLTGISLLAAILVAVPLGVLAARRPRLGQLVLALVGIVQTIPSLALLVFMIPLLGIGARPAIVALFLYSLLPIVRNTHAGLADIPRPLRESAEALGLSARAILWRVELPLASRAILAGIKSAAVINVGTATLGALIGAGGFGQPIFTGIRLDDVGQILEGAIPASLLALAVQGAFELVERVALPRGLRLTGVAGRPPLGHVRGRLYRLLFRLVLRFLSAEWVHGVAFALLRLVTAVPGVRALMARRLAPRAPELVVTALGRQFPGPVGLAAGFDKDARAYQALGALGFGFIEVGTVTPLAQAGNPRPRMWRLPADWALLNRLGFNNRGMQAAARRLATPRQVVCGVNVGKSRVTPAEQASADYVAAASLLGPLADYLVVNVSSPNTPGLRALQQVDALRPLLVAVRAALAQASPSRVVPLLVKIDPDLPDGEIDGIAGLALELGLDGIIATNTTLAGAALGLRSPPALLGDPQRGGLSGAPLKARSLAVLRRLRAMVGARLVLISVGGIESVDDVWQRLAAGATLVQLYTSFIYEGPLHPCRLHAGLAARLRAAGLPSVTALIGSEAPAPVDRRAALP